jgi:lipid II:glycine glycyltransferase (peptidoglycan interpeptide bridge formation enzyme)
LPPQPWHFFEKLHEQILARGMGTVALAFFQGNAVAANVYLHANGEAIYKYGASDKAWQSLRAANLVMWEAVKRYAGQGVRSLCFGRTEPENEGLRQFKTGWGTDESIINYYRYDLAVGAFVPGPKAVSARANHIFSRMPIPALKAIGGLLYRHMG